MLRIDNLPDFVFINEDGEETRLRLSHRGRQIRGMASGLLKDFPAGSVLGLIAPSGSDLVLAWLACVDAGMKPLILQYPNSKQSRKYWSDSVRNTIALVDLKAVIVDDHVATLDISDFLVTVRLSELLWVAPSSDICLQIDVTEILQLSSGTTGHRKAIAFSGDDLEDHVNSYNQILGLTRDDRIVSWLPLYHDMGFIACFVMPLILGIEVIMMDPMTWVRDPRILYSAIVRHRGTVCYMPNFGYEVMARQQTALCPP